METCPFHFSILSTIFDLNLLLLLISLYCMNACVYEAKMNEMGSPSPLASFDDHGISGFRVNGVYFLSKCVLFFLSNYLLIAPVPFHLC